MGALLCVALALAACHGEQRAHTAFDGATALTYVKTQLDFGPRIPNSDGARRCEMALSVLRFLHQQRDGLLDTAGESPSVVVEVRALISSDALAGSFLQNAASARRKRLHTGAG